MGGRESQTDAHTVGAQQRTAQCVIIGVVPIRSFCESFFIWGGLLKHRLVLLLLSVVPSLSAQTYTRWEIGPVFSTIFLNKSLNQFQPQLGGRLTFNVSRFLAVDSEMSSSLVSLNAASNYDGGYALQFLCGAKATARHKSFALFAKARPGLISYSGAIQSLQNVPPFVITQRIGEFAMDIGGGIEFFAGRRLVFRYDLGDTVVHQPALHGTFPLPAHNVNNVQFETAVAFRF